MVSTYASVMKKILSFNRLPAYTGILFSTCGLVKANLPSSYICSAYTVYLLIDLQFKLLQDVVNRNSLNN